MTHHVLQCGHGGKCTTGNYGTVRVYGCRWYFVVAEDENGIVELYCNENGGIPPTELQTVEGLPG